MCSNISFYSYALCFQLPKDEAVAQALVIVDLNNVELENAQRELVEVEEVSTLNALAVARLICL